MKMRKSSSCKEEYFSMACLPEGELDETFAWCNIIDFFKGSNITPPLQPFDIVVSYDVKEETIWY